MTFEDLKKELEGRSFTAKRVEIHYNPTCSTSRECPFKAVVFVDGKEQLYEVPCISVGFEGPGPRKVADILDFLRLEYRREDIFTDAQRDAFGVIHLSIQVLS